MQCFNIEAYARYFSSEAKQKDFGFLCYMTTNINYIFIIIALTLVSVTQHDVAES